MRTLGIVPARGGSKGIPGKNQRTLAGRPLLAYTIDAISESRHLDRTILSTDSTEIAEIGRNLGLEVPFLRPPELARDDTPMLPVLQHAVAYIERGGWPVDCVVILQPTSPFRRGSHIDRAIALLEGSKRATSVASVVEIPAHYSPQYAMKITAGRLDHYLPSGRAKTRRQDVEPAYSRDGTVYAIRRDVVMLQHEILGSFCVPLILSHDESANLDSPEDWAAAEARLAT